MWKTVCPPLCLRTFDGESRWTPAQASARSVVSQRPKHRLEARCRSLSFRASGRRSHRDGWVYIWFASPRCTPIRPLVRNAHTRGGGDAIGHTWRWRSRRRWNAQPGRVDGAPTVDAAIQRKKNISRAKGRGCLVGFSLRGPPFAHSIQCTGYIYIQCRPYGSRMNICFSVIVHTPF